ncbi:MAG TPA: aldose epimerase family protein [Bacillales bacterium]|nr:aldose epimerase family protein [Bacillales bacterium]
MEILKERFGEVNGQTVSLFTMKNDKGMTLACLDYGCVITKILVPDRNGNVENVVLGFDSLDDYLQHSPYFGAVVGRVAGRIKQGRFELNGKSYELPQNENQNHIHGGPNGFSHVLWDAKVLEGENEARIEFSYKSPDGEEGYPGTVDMKVTYQLNNQNELVISYDGLTDQDTLLNVTNHSYFNLSGNLKRDVLDHKLLMRSQQFLELDGELLPTGQVKEVEDTPFDFREGRKLQSGPASSHPQNKLVGNGYDHPFLLSENQQKEIILTDEESGRKLVIETDQPSVVLYTGNQLQGDLQIRGTRSKKHLGVCLETQGPPDSIHHPQFQSAVLEKGKAYHSETSYWFTTTN